LTLIILGIATVHIEQHKAIDMWVWILHELSHPL
jgi:hypothetical protein